jgi:hypothetical protein
LRDGKCVLGAGGDKLKEFGRAQGIQLGGAALFLDWERKTMEWPPPPTSTLLVVRSCAQSFSLIRNRWPHRDWDNPSRSRFFAAHDHGPKPSEVYGFVGSITTIIAIVVYVA